MRYGEASIAGRESRISPQTASGFHGLSAKPAHA